MPRGNIITVRRYEHKADNVRLFIDRANASSLWVTVSVIEVRACGAR